MQLLEDICLGIDLWIIPFIKMTAQEKAKEQGSNASEDHQRSAEEGHPGFKSPLARVKLANLHEEIKLLLSLLTTQIRTV